MSILQDITDGLKRLGDQAALISEGQPWTAAHILASTARMASLLRQRGAQAGRTLHWRDGEVCLVLPARLASMQLGLRFTTATPVMEGDNALVITDTEVQMAGAAHEGDLRTEEAGAFEVVRGAPTWDAHVFGELLGTMRRLFGPSPGSVAVLCPLTGFGGDAVFAAWCSGLSVHHLPAMASVAKALVFLERSAATCAVTPGPLLRGIIAHPATRLATLDSLGRFVYEADERGPLSATEAAAALGMFHMAPVGLVAGERGMAPVEQAQDRIEQEAGRIVDRISSHPDVAAAAAVTADGSDWTVFVVPRPQPFDPAERLAPDRRLLDHVATRLDAEFSGVDMDAAVAMANRLGQTALLSMLHTLRRNGLFSHSDTAHTADEVLLGARVAAQHQPLIRRWLRVLGEQGLLRRDGDRLRCTLAPGNPSDATLASQWDALQIEWAALAGSAGTIDYARRNAEQLPDLLTGAAQAVHLLFPQGRTDLARALYRENIAARYQHHAVAGLVGRITADWREPRPIRLLEIGAGTGATTDTLLPALAGRNVDYLYTDVSRFFLEQAKSRLAGNPSLRFGLYDIDTAPGPQGAVPNSFDIIVGGGVLNAASDTDASVRWLVELLRPGGWLVLTEPTVEEFWVMASQAFMMTSASDGRAETKSTFLTLPQWNRVLDDAGLQRLCGLPQEGHPLATLGHRLFAARAKMGLVPLAPSLLSKHMGSPLLGSGIRFEIADQLPLTGGGVPDHHRLRTWAKQLARFDARIPA